MKKLLGTILIAVLFFSGCSAACNQRKLEFSTVYLDAAVPSEGESDIAETGMTEYSPNFIDTPSARTYLYESEQDLDVPKKTGQSPLIYATFNQMTDTMSAEDNTMLFTGQFSKPAIITEQESINIWLNEVIVQIVSENQIRMQNIKDQAFSDYSQSVTAGDKSGSFYAYSYYCTMDVQRLDHHIISLTQLENSYRGGVHPQSYLRAFNFDLPAQKILQLTDVIKPGSFALLKDRLLNHLKERQDKFEKIGLFSNYQDRVNSYFSNPSSISEWYFSNNGLIIYFDGQDIAPYLSGIIKVEIPYSSLNDVLMPEYFPDLHSIEDGTEPMQVFALEQPVELKKSSKGSQILIQMRQPVNDVKIRRIDSWVSQKQLAAGPVIMSVNRMNPDNLLEIPNSDWSQTTQYLLTFCTAAGEQQMLALSLEGIEKVDFVIYN